MARRGGGTSVDAAGRVVRVYITTTALFTLAASLIWGVNTLFLLNAGLTLFQVMLVNSTFSLGQVIFEIPTGVVADTIGRRASFAFGIATVMVSTLLYVATAQFGWGLVGFIGASATLGLGFTFQTGAVDAWLVDALDHLKSVRVRSEVFARGGMVSGVTMLFGTLAGGFLGQVNLSIPYLVRAGVLGIALLVVIVFMRDIGFEPRALKLSRIGTEARTILHSGTVYGWRHPVVRPLMLISLVQGTFMMYFFYSSQPYALDLLGRPDLVWVAGVVTALFGLSGVIGNVIVKPLVATAWGKCASRVLAVGTALAALFIVAIALAGQLAPSSGSVLSFAGMVLASALYGVTSGVLTPVRQAFINEHIPSAQRATVLSLDSFFADVGGAGGQPAFGWLSGVTSIPVTYFVGAVAIGAGVPLYRLAGRRSTKDTCSPEQVAAAAEQHGAGEFPLGSESAAR